MRNWKLYKVWTSIMVPIVIVALGTISALDNPPPLQNEKQYPLRLQPELDSLNISHILRTERLLNFQVKCLLYNGPCDVVGRWVKPRVRAAILGECLKCTKVQEGWMDEWMDKLINNRPELYRAAVAKYITNIGIPVPAEELTRINQTLARIDN